MHRRLYIGWLLLIGLGAYSSLLAQPAVHTRVFRSGGSYPSILSVSTSGSVIAKSGDSSLLTVMDGYAPREIRMPEVITYRVLQSRSGQIWSVSAEGLLLFHSGQWTNFALPEIRAFLAEPARNLRQIALLPAEVNHVLVLFPDRLLDFDATSRQTKILRESSTTGLGEFSEIQDGWDDAIWISGSFGVARLQGPARRLTPQSTWIEYPLPNTNRVHTLQRPFENPSGEITVSANSPNSEARSIAMLQRSEWSTLPVTAEKIRQAWRDWDGQLWGLSTVSLFRVHDDEGGIALQRFPVSGAQYDLAVETNGVFWAASGEGVVRYGPQLWRTPPDLEDLQVSVHSLLLGTDNSVWLATPAGLVSRKGGQRRTFPWPEEIESLPPRQSMFRTPEGKILLGGPNRPFLFDPARNQFDPMEAAPDALPHLVGQLMDGRVIVWMERSAGETPLDLRVARGERLEPIEISPEGLTRVTSVSFVKEASNGDLWVCTGSGFLRIRRTGGLVEHHGPEIGLRTDRVYALAEVGDGRMWCGTASRIYEFRGQRWEPILNTMDRVTDIVASGGSIWVSTASGVQRSLDNAWFAHGSNEGIPLGGVYGLRVGPDQKLWAATSRGAFVFHPEADTDPPRTFSPRLDEEQKPSAGQPTTVYFHAHDKWDYTKPADLLFSYRLDEGNWTPYSNISSRVFQKLSAGAHAVEVSSMDRNGNKSLDSSRIEFSVIVPWSSDPRLISVLVLAGILSAVLAGLAVNKHIQLKRSYAEVEKIVEERTRDLNRATQELIHAQKMRALGTMAAGIAHDFNNILSIIKGSAQIIENHVEDKEKIRTRVNRIQMVVEQGTVIVKALLGLGKTGAKEVAECDVGQLLHESRKLLSDRFPPTIQIQINLSPDIPRISCTSEVLQQILLNLILNAAESMHNQGVVELKAEFTRTLPIKLVLDPPIAEGNQKSWVILSVVDEGGGIAPANVPRIFEPFFTTKAFSSRRGTGLGLSMVYELAKELGYGIRVETRMGEGSTFSIIVPT